MRKLRHHQITGRNTVRCMAAHGGRAHPSWVSPTRCVSQWGARAGLPSDTVTQPRPRLSGGSVQGVSQGRV